MKLLLTLILLTVLPVHAEYKAGYNWHRNPDCTPAKTIEWIKPINPTFAQRCPQKSVWMPPDACIERSGDKAYVYSELTEDQASKVDSFGISLAEHEYYHTQCFTHDTQLIPAYYRERK